VIDIKNNSIYYRSLYYVILMVLFMMLGYMFFVSGIDNKTKIKTYYQSNSDVDYKINYEDELNTEIKNIDFNYKYSSVFSENMNGYYKYNVLAYLYAYGDNISDTIWFRKYDLVDEKIVSINNNDNVELRDSFKLNFKKYQSELSAFIDSQEDEINGYLNIKINVIEYLNINDEINNRFKDRVININVPINDNPIIDIDNVSVEDSYFNFNTHNIMNFVLITLSLFCFSVSIALLALMIRQFKIINDRQNKYSKRLKKLLHSYDYCIVKVNKLYVNKKYNMIYVSNFDDLLDIYVSRNKMISFKEVKRGVESIFVIIDSNDAWIYKLTSDNVE